MKIDLKRRLAILPALLCSAAAVAARPVLLGPQDMDRITAGSQPVLERLADALKTVQTIRSGLGLSDSPAVMLDQHWLAQLVSDEQVTFQRTASGELVATEQLQSGGRLVIVKQSDTANAAAVSQLNPGDTVTMRLLQPGETLSIQQSGANGINYLYVHGAGNTAVTISRQHL